MYMEEILGLKSIRNNTTISPHIILCYSNLKSYMCRLYETNIIRLQVSEIYIYT